MKKIYLITLLFLSLILVGCILKPTNVTVDQNELNFDGLIFRVGDKYIQKLNQNTEEFENIFINAVNLGIALPGKQPGETDIPKKYYDRWFKMLGENGVNVVRIYTLHMPQFYQSLQEYNLKNPNNPMYVLHGVWLNYTGEVSLDSHDEQFEQEIRENVQAIHGDIEIEQRYGKAWGNYEFNVSPWIMGWIIGREIGPYELEATDGRMNAEEAVDLVNYEGEYFAIKDVPKSTAWIVEKIDYLAEYEKENYNNERPISFSSWPTLDPLNHPSEVTDEDIAELQLYKIEKRNTQTGYFASYHAYPYYPEFIDTDLKYEDYTDSYGPNPYIGYLTELRDKYGSNKIPLFIAEYGVPSSWGNAKYADSGMNHGGHTEVEQGEYVVRMINDIYDLGLAGGAYFSLFDEWWKKCWINEPLTFPIDRYKLWHDVTNPEQNYGLLTFTPNTLIKEKLNITNYATSDIKYLKEVYASVDAQYFSLDIYLENDFTETFYIAFDTYKKDVGEYVLKNDKEIRIGSELLLEVDLIANEANLYVTEEYDLKGIWFEDPEIITRKWHTEDSTDGGWNLVTWQNRQAYTVDYGNEKITYPEEFQEIGKLRLRNNADDPSNLDAVIKEWKRIKVRLPWVLLQFSDPSKSNILYGYESESRDIITNRVSDGISMSFNFYDELSETNKFKIPNWDIISFYELEKKKSFDIFMRNARSLPFIIN
ncbi:hypothetical protein [Geotoga petraea]|uniref:Glycosyl hydrolases family 2, TIM barrel domain n=1 Tax=Geotoga petraea TaxID=28234 RepID=A0A4Z0VZD4_9BACT|nr:hypothetical protein [Geotoga petraea]TGG87396.1 hypothetical protein E4650_08825 [Geotoga petraea]